MFCNYKSVWLKVVWSKRPRQYVLHLQYLWLHCFCDCFYNLFIWVYLTFVMQAYFEIFSCNNISSSFIVIAGSSKWKVKALRQFQWLVSVLYCFIHRRNIPSFVISIFVVLPGRDSEFSNVTFPSKLDPINLYWDNILLQIFSKLDSIFHEITSNVSYYLLRNLPFPAVRYFTGKLELVSNILWMVAAKSFPNYFLFQ